VWNPGGIFLAVCRYGCLGGNSVRAYNMWSAGIIVQMRIIIIEIPRNAMPVVVMQHA
jgi:hypothetical protein